MDELSPNPTSPEQPKFAKCRTCGGYLKHPPLVGYMLEDGTIERVHSYHADCVPDDERAGQQYIRRRENNGKDRD